MAPAWTELCSAVHAECVEDPERDALIASVSRQFTRLVMWARAERVAGGDDDEHGPWLDRLIAELEPLAEQAHDLETLRAVRSLVCLHGPGPWPVDDVVAMTGRDAESVSRVLGGLAGAGLAMSSEVVGSNDD